MLDQHTLNHAETGDSLNAIDTDHLLETLAAHGYCLLRGYQPDLKTFNALINRICTDVTYDPARALSADSIQKVDAGVAAIGLHIENGNTPKVPHVLGFFCRKAASAGSQTTVCDGQLLWQEMGIERKQQFNGALTVTRTLSELQWKSYLAQEHPALHSAEQVTEHHLQQMLVVYDNQRAVLNPDGTLEYSLTTNAVRTSPLSRQPAFANTILGPSFNYETPQFRLENCDPLSDDQVESLRAYAEQHTIEINWQSGDILLLDNWRVMHGRRAITDAANRELFIGMGMV